MSISKTILITGASGLIGTRLTTRLVQEGYRVRHLGRKTKANGIPSFTWDIGKKLIDPRALNGVDTIVHLAGAGIADKRWTKSRKEEILSSRTRSAELLYEAVAKHHPSVKTFITASGIGYYGYGDRNEVFSEDRPPADDFPAKVCVAWENAADTFTTVGIRVVKLRTGIVLSGRGGALEKLALPVKLGAGAPLGSGNQMMSWIHSDDLCGMYVKAIADDNMRGPYNAVAPNAVTNSIMTKSIARVLGKPLILPTVPSWFIHLLLGEMAEMVLQGSVVSPKKIESAGYQFVFPELESALQDLLGRN